MSASRARLEMLLVSEATEGLTPEEVLELETLLEQLGDFDRYGFERAAANVFLAAAATSPVSMPEDLYQRIIASGQRSLEEAD